MDEQMKKDQELEDVVRSCLVTILPKEIISHILIGYLFRIELRGSFKVDHDSLLDGKFERNCEIICTKRKLYFCTNFYTAEGEREFIVYQCVLDTKKYKCDNVNNFLWGDNFGIVKYGAEKILMWTKRPYEGSSLID